MVTKNIQKGTLWTQKVAYGYKKHQKGDPLVTFENFRKKSHRAENTVREYPLVPLNFLDDVKNVVNFCAIIYKFAC